MSVRVTCELGKSSFAIGTKWHGAADAPAPLDDPITTIFTYFLIDK